MEDKVDDFDVDDILVNNGTDEDETVVIGGFDVNDSVFGRDEDVFGYVTVDFEAAVVVVLIEDL